MTGLAGPRIGTTSEVQDSRPQGAENPVLGMKSCWTLQVSWISRVIHIRTGIKRVDLHVHVHVYVRRSPSDQDFIPDKSTEFLRPGRGGVH